jgi:DNA-binding CsgD family transcriptional regulator
VSWVGSAQDVTDQRLSERELQAHDAVNQALRDWETFEEGVVDLLRRVGTALDAPMGSLWHWDSARKVLVCRAFWCAPAVDAGDFELAIRGLTFRLGEGKLGRAWQTQEPVITSDIATDPVFRPRDVAMRCGLRSAVAFPAVGPHGPVAVVSFYDFERRVPSCTLARTLTGIGGALGRFLSRRRAELGVQPLTDREVEVLRLAAEGNSGPEIACRLGLRPSTIKSHFDHIYEKLGVSDRGGAVAYGIRIGLIQ